MFFHKNHMLDTLDFTGSEAARALFFFLRRTALLLVFMQTDVLTISNSYCIWQIILYILYEECLPCVALILYIYLLVHVLQGGTKLKVLSKSPGLV